MEFRSLKHRIVIVFVGLLLLVMALMLALVTRSNARIVNAEIQRELAAGTQVFTLLIEQNQRQLETAASILAADFAFREAIATQDRATIASVIRNHGLRIGAQAMLVIRPDGRLIASSQGNDKDSSSRRFADLLSAAEVSGKSSGFKQMQDGRLYQIVLVPIYAPKLIAWVAMGFLVDDRWARDLADMTGLVVSVIHRSGSDIAILASSLKNVERAALSAAVKEVSMDMPGELRFGNEHYQTVHAPLSKEIVVALQRSVEQAEAPFQTLQTALWIIVLVSVVVFAVGSIMLARRIVKPVNELAGAARRIEAGDYTEAVPRLSADEIGQLATSFDHMRERVANREQKILKLAYEDSLTGLPNRTRFIEEFNRLPDSSRGAVVVMNLDRFAPINNALGHPVGDRLLTEIGRRLSAFQSKANLVGRFWGDEFVFLLRDADRAAAGHFAESLATALRDPFVLDGQRLDVDASMGIALYPDDGRDAATLLRRAELAMYSAKRQHSRISFAAQAGDKPLHEQLSLIGEMRDAMEHQEFLLYYQPKLDLHSGQVTAVEALIRWRHPQRGMVPPGKFIPFAEKTGFIRELTPWVLETVIAQTARWRAQGINLVPAVNLSALDLLNANLIQHLRQSVAKHNLTVKALCLEITESALMQDPELALTHLHQLAALGFKLSIDDYGVGQASLAYLRSLPVHELKIDGSFIRAVAETPKNAAIVRSTIGLCHALGLSVVGECAETAEDIAWLTANHCDLAQGYAIAKPMPAEEMANWLSSYGVRRRQQA
ncbi:MAG: EAL domain-containing protein [Gammaproteobacteria bacterium]|nr:EAL domain-containing protein [Gammaproteobacteria bacterium]